MTETFRLGRIAGVNVGVNWSVLVIFALIAYGLAAERLPASYPGGAAGAYITVGLLAAVVFFLSLLAHELAHAILARRHGVSVEGITLWLFGGVARLQGEAPSPSAELRIAGVGPLVSLILGVGFLSGAVALDAIGVGGLPIGAVAWLGAINIALAVFNVIPAAPLDGGRLLRALVWWRTGDRLRATIRATQAGQGFGWALIVFGLLFFLTTAAFGGLWLALIGWFLVGAATMEGQQATLRERLSSVPVREVMTADPMTAPGGVTVAEFLDGDLFRRRHSTFPVTGAEGNPVGLVTLNSIKRVSSEDRARVRLDTIACPMEDVATASPSEPVADLLPRLTACAEGRALVLDGGRVVGIVSPTDVTRTLEWMGLRGQRFPRR